MSDPTLLETPRLLLRPIEASDAAFAFELVNEPDWKRWIGERHVHSIDDARAMIESRWRPGYERPGFGFLLVARRADGAPLGICGIVHREGLEAPDLGFALLARHYGQGYAHEAAARCVAHARETLRLPRLLAITLPENVRSIALLERLGMRHDGTVRLPGDDEELRLYALELPPAS